MKYEMIEITAEQVQKALTMSECINVMEDLFKNERLAQFDQPRRTLTRIDPHSIILTMPGYSKTLSRFAVKIVSEFQNNAGRFSLPVQGGLTVLIDGKNSRTLALLDSPAITALRTGAVSGLATKYLSRKESRSVAVIGSGQQATTQLEAVCAVREISKAMVYSRSYANAVNFSKTMSEKLNIRVDAVETREDALKGSDIAILSTNSSKPVIAWSEIPKGCHLNSIGVLPERTEVDVDTICNSKLFVDSRSGVLGEAGDVMLAVKTGRVSEGHIAGDLFDLADSRCSGRDDEKQVTLFKSVGFALQDVYACSAVYDSVSAKD